MDGPSPQSKLAVALTRASTVELSLVLMLCGAIAGGASWATRINVAQESLAISIMEVKAMVRDGTSDRWTGAQQRAWVRECNREVELWSERLERQLALEFDLARFRFPDPDNQMAGR